MKTYTCDKKKFAISMTTVGVFCVLICLYSLYKIATGTGAFAFILLVALYQVHNTFVSISNPREVTLSKDELSFSAYGVTHTYPLKDIYELRIKELDYHKKMYVRVNDANLFKGRYWINCFYFSDGEELWDALAYLEYKISPDHIKFRARVPENPFEDKENENTENE